MALKSAIATAESPPIEDLFSNLNHFINKFKNDQAAKVADQVLAIAPGDENAVRCKVVALITSEVIDEALSAILGFESLPIDLRFHKEMLMEENEAEDDIETDLAPISVQLAYVLQLLGNTQEAIESYKGVISCDLADASSIAVATNNLIALRGTKDTSDSLRKLDRLIEKFGDPMQFQLVNGLDFKLSQRQKEALYSNRVLLLLQGNKLDQAEELVSALPDMFPDTVTPVLLQAAVHVRKKKVPKAEEILGQFALCRHFLRNPSQSFSHVLKLLLLLLATLKFPPSPYPKYLISNTCLPPLRQ